MQPIRILCCLAFLTAPFCLPAAAGARILDGARVVDSGSSNAPGWTIAVRSDGAAWLTVAGGATRWFRRTPALAATFLDDVAAARAAGIAERSCMKSVSFGTSVWVEWHGWRSPDLACPTTGAANTTLARDVAALENAAGANSIPLRRIRLPIEPRRIELPLPAASTGPGQHPLQER